MYTTDVRRQLYFGESLNPSDLCRHPGHRHPKPAHARARPPSISAFGISNESIGSTGRHSPTRLDLSPRGIWRIPQSRHTRVAVVWPLHTLDDQYLQRMEVSNSIHSLALVTQCRFEPSTIRPQPSLAFQKDYRQRRSQIFFQKLVFRSIHNGRPNFRTAPSQTSPKATNTAQSSLDNVASSMMGVNTRISLSQSALSNSASCVVVLR